MNIFVSWRFVAAETAKTFYSKSVNFRVGLYDDRYQTTSDLNGVHLEESLKVLDLQLEDTEGAESVMRLSLPANTLFCHRIYIEQGHIWHLGPSVSTEGGRGLGVGVGGGYTYT